MKLPALTNSLDTVRRHLESGGKAAYRTTFFVREVWLKDGEVVIPDELDDDGVEWKTIPAPEPIEGQTAYVLVSDDDIGADPEGRWVP